MLLQRPLAKCLILIGKLKARMLRSLYRGLFKKTGRNLIFFPGDSFSYETISIGDNVYIGPGAVFRSVTSISIGDNVMIGPEVMIIGGNHNTALTGKPMRENVQKRPFDDAPVVVCEDAWICARALILKGVTIGRGAIVAAGSVVIDDVPPYTVAAGCPAVVVKSRASRAEVLEHERQCYPHESRLAESALDCLRE